MAVHYVVTAEWEREIEIHILPREIEQEGGDGERSDRERKSRESCTVATLLDKMQMVAFTVQPRPLMHYAAFV